MYYRFTIAALFSLATWCAASFRAQADEVGDSMMVDSVLLQAQIGSGLGYSNLTFNAATPQATALGRYGDVGASPFTGAAGIEIPIITLQSRGVEMPIKLDYDGSGVKMNSLPTCVGYNWNLLAGGVITRSMQGECDEYVRPPITDQLIAGEFMNYFSCHQQIPTWLANADSLRSRLGDDNYYDMRPDVFYYNFMGHTGRFFLGNDGQWRVAGDEDIDVIFDVVNDSNYARPFVEHYPNTQVPYLQPKTIYGFRLRDTQGTVYEFGYDTNAIEYTTPFQSAGNLEDKSSWLATAWYLRKVSDRFGNELFSLDYERSTFSAQTFYELEVVKKSENAQDFWIGNYGENVEYGYEAYFIQLDAPVRLKQINTSNGIHVEFHYNTLNFTNFYKGAHGEVFSDINWLDAHAYYDNTPFYYLQDSRFSAYWPAGAQNGKNGTSLLLRTCLGIDQLSSIYIHDTAPQMGHRWVRFNYLNGTEQEPKRIRLTKVKMSYYYQGGETPFKEYGFEYDRMDNLPFEVTTRLIDHWGYYNGRDYKLSFNENNFYECRNTDTTFVKRGMLTRITYPTGGVSVIEYEPHEYRPHYEPGMSPTAHLTGERCFAGGVRVKSIKEYEDTTCQHLHSSRTFDYNEPLTGNCSGELYQYPRYKWYNWVARKDNGVTIEMTLLRNTTFVPLVNSFGTHIGYSTVTETLADGSRQVYHYDNLHDFPRDTLITTNGFNTASRTPFDVYTSRGYHQGKLLLKECYSADNRKTSASRMNYRPMGSEDDAVWGSSIVLNYGATSGSFHYYTGRAYKLFHKRYDLVERIDTTFYEDGAKNVSSTNYYRYDHTLNVGGGTSRYAHQVQLRLLDSMFKSRAGHATGESFKYPHDISDTCTQHLETRYFTITPIETSHILDNQLITKNTTQYGYTLAGDATNGRDLLLPLRQIVSHPQRVDTVITFNRYTYSGQISCYYKLDNMPVSLTWAHNDNYLAVIANGVISVSHPPLYDRVIFNADSMATVAKYVMAHISPSSQVTTYSYSPLNGITSITNPDATTTYYDYDRDKGWLTLIADDQKVTLTQYAYNYRTNKFGGDNLIDTKLYTSASAYMQSTSYFDGLGRPQLQVERQFTPQSDLTAMTNYDLLGRAWQSWLSTPMPSSQNRPDTIALKAAAITFYGDSIPFDTFTYADNPYAEEVEKHCGPGKRWRQNDRLVNMHYYTNHTEDGELFCRRYFVQNNGSLTCPTMGYYEGELDVVKTVDEDFHTSLTFTDQWGHVVLQRKENDTLAAEKYADTYYVYDDRGNLRYILPPLASAALTASNVYWNRDTAAVANYAFCYNYDDRDLCVSKKMPGCDEVLIRRDKTGREIFTQDGNQRPTGKWTFTIPDRFGREAMCGIHTGEPPEISSKVVSANYINNTSQGYHLNVSVDRDNILWNRYYDSYDFVNKLGASMADSLGYRNIAGYDAKFNGYDGTTPTKGHFTGALTRVLGDTTFLASVSYYDHHGNLVQQHETNNLGGFDHYYYHRSLPGTILDERHDQSVSSGESHYETKNYQRDSRERIIGITLVNDGVMHEEVYKEYNQLGQTDVLWQDDAAFSTSYTYNLRGWVTSIDCPGVFRQTLRYTDADWPCYNGDVAAVEWNDGNAAANVFRYDYDYDGLDRLTAANFSVRDAATGEPVTLQHGTPNYSASYAYDLNSNLTSLTRNGYKGRIRVGASFRRLYGPIDDVVFTLDGNRAVRATDLCDDLTIAGAMEFTDKANKAVEYAYDANGNLTADQNRGIDSIRYNELDLPERVTFDDGKRIYYTYAADGRKLRVRYAQLNSHVGPITPIEDPFPMGGGTAGLNGGGMGDPGGGLEPVLDETVLLTRDYCGGHIWRDDTLERVMTDYGYFDGAGTYHAYVKDHQGNVRAVVAGGEVVERDDYYPYGMPIAGACQPSAEGVQPLKYTSKELDRFNRLDLYDFGARPYDPTRCAFLTHDPLAEDDPATGPTVFCAANPVRFTDPTGEKIFFVNGLPLRVNPGTDYWGGKNSSFIKGATEFFDDKNYYCVPVEHNLLSNAKERYNKGIRYALYNFKALTSDMKDGESIKLVSHSMGAAFAEGMAATLHLLGKEVSTMVHLNAFQAADIKTIDESDSGKVVTIDYQNTDDPIINHLPLVSSPGSIQGADYIIREDSGKKGPINKHMAPIFKGKEFWKEFSEIYKKMTGAIKFSLSDSF